MIRVKAREKSKFRWTSYANKVKIQLKNTFKKSPAKAVGIDNISVIPAQNAN